MKQAISFLLEPNLNNVPLVGVSAKAIAEYLGLSSEDASAFELALVEALNNSIEHGEAESECKVTIELSVEDLQIEVAVSGLGPEFRPPERAELPQNLSEGGYGLFILEAFADNLKWSRKDGLNCLFFSKDLKTMRSHKHANKNDRR